MSQLIAITFPGDIKAAFDLRARFIGMSKAHITELRDAIVVIRDEDGKIKLDHLHDLTVEGAFSGAFWGLLLGFVFSLPLFGPGAIVVPFLGLGVGAGLGAIGGHYADLGLDDSFVEQVSETMVPGSSAVFVLVEGSTPDRVLDELRGMGGHVLTTSLSKQAQRKLEQTLQPVRDALQEQQQTQATAS